MTKAQLVNSAVRDLFTRFKASRIKDNFSFAVVTFDGSAKQHTPISSTDEIDDYADYDPMAAHGGGTDIAAGVSQAMQIAKAHLDAYEPGGPEHSAILLVMSDGMDQNASQTKSLVDQIKSSELAGRITIATVLVGLASEASEEGAAEHLRDLASNPVVYHRTVYNAAALRDFFIKSISASSGTAL